MKLIFESKNGKYYLYKDGRLLKPTNHIKITIGSTKNKNKEQ